MKDAKYVILILVILFGIIIFQEYKISQLDNKTTVNVDSLQNELFIKQTEVGRYEMALEMLKEEDSIAASKFENILYTKTE